MVLDVTIRSSPTFDGRKEHHSDDDDTATKMPAAEVFDTMRSTDGATTTLGSNPGAHRRTEPW